MLEVKFLNNKKLIMINEMKEEITKALKKDLHNLIKIIKRNLNINWTNKIKCHDTDRGTRWTDELENEYTTPYFEDYPNCPKFIMIKINDYNINKNGGFYSSGIYGACHWCWKTNPNSANKYPYVIAVRYGIVIGVFEINKNGWKRVENSKRSYFDGIEAPKEIKKIFIKKRFLKDIEKDKILQVISIKIMRSLYI